MFFNYLPQYFYWQEGVPAGHKKTSSHTKGRHHPDEEIDQPLPVQQPSKHHKVVKHKETITKEHSERESQELTPISMEEVDQKIIPDNHEPIDQTEDDGDVGL